MTKQGLVELFDRISAEVPTLGRWDTKVDEESIKIFVNMKGSEVCKDFPLVKSEMYFSAGTTVENVLSAIHDDAQRPLWDKDVEHAEVFSNPERNIQLWH